jgi:predicted dinucleotide-binding enzyme
MTTISIIGSGNMATAIGTRAANHGHTIELMSRNTAKAQARRPDRQRSHRRHVRRTAGG